jgi:hypothetical protein
MASEWSLAVVEAANAYWFSEHHVVRIRGSLPTRGYDVNLDRSLLDVEPPGFIARWRERPGIWPRRIVPYDYREAFKVGSRRDEVTVDHEGGRLTVPVEDYAMEPAATAATAASEVRVSNLHDPLTGQELELNEAVGYSTAWDFGEAFRAAVAALPDQNPGGIADFLYHYEVVSVGAEIGGFAGFNHLWVRARG